MPASSLPTSNRSLIYLVEDDEDVGRVVVRVLEDFEFLVEWFRDGASVLRRLKTEHPDLCILDLGLPDMDGTTLIKQVSALHNCGVLVLTGRGHPFDRVMGLEMGSDDYVVKPFEPRELVARVRSILRRSGAPGGHSSAPVRRYARFLGWMLDCASNTLTSPDGTEHLLSTAETQVLRVCLSTDRTRSSRASSCWGNATCPPWTAASMYASRASVEKSRTTRKTPRSSKPSTGPGTCSPHR
jgi:two-component system OmpR family response regulator